VKLASREYVKGEVCRSAERLRHEVALISLWFAAVILFLILESGIVLAQNTPKILLEGGEAREEVIFDDRRSTCQLRQLPDSPARAVRQADGEIVLFTAFENNWFMDGKNWADLKPDCASAGRGAENPDPNVVNDKYWIQALHTLDGKRFIALGSHEYLGIRQGKCDLAATNANPFPCWYSSITQYFSHDDAKHFLPATTNYVVAQPQIAFDRTRSSRVGFFTTSNVVADGEYRYVLIYTQGAEGQANGNCLFRAALTPEPSKWWGWDGSDFNVDLSKRSDATSAHPSCVPVSGLDREVRGLVKHRETGIWIAVYTGRDRDVTGVFYSVSKDLFHWNRGENILRVAVARTEPDCPPVYRYPSIIDHDAPGFSFDTVGNKAFLYGVKIIFEGCRKYSGRQIVRMPLSLSGAR
jgi:hypothetical protein